MQHSKTSYDLLLVIFYVQKTSMKIISVP